MLWWLAHVLERTLMLPGPKAGTIIQRHLEERQSLVKRF